MTPGVRVALLDDYQDVAMRYGGLGVDIVAIQDIFRLSGQRLDADGREMGEVEPTGIRPGFADCFEMFGVSESC